MAPPGLPQFEGRDHELEILVAAFDACRSARVGQAIAIHGASGSGSSAVARQLHDELRGRGLGHHWWAGRCTRTAPLPYEPFAGLLRAVPGDATAWLAEAAAVGSNEAAGVALLAGLARRIRAASDAKPVVVFIDDVDGADPSTARVLAGVVPLLDDVPVLVVFAGRSTAAGLPPQGLRQVCSAEVVVSPLDDDETARLVRGAAPELAETAVGAIVRTAGGRPAIALALAAAGDTDRALSSLLAATSAEAPAATLASGLADGWIPAGELSEAIGLDPAIWSELERHHVVVTSDRPANGPVPAADLWFTAARRAMGPGVRPLAAAVAELLEGRGPAATIAAVWEIAARPDRASDGWERAAGEAESDLAIETAAAALRRAIELGGDPALIRLGRRAGELSLAAGDRLEADLLAERLLPRLPRHDGPGAIGTLMLRYRARTEAGLAGADAQLDRALAIDVEPCPESIDALVVDSLRRVLEDPSAAAAQAARALADATAIDHLSGIAAAAGAAGLAAAIAGDLDAGLAHFDAALEAAARTGDAAAEARLASNRVYVLWRAGRPEDVERAAAIELDRLRVRGLSALGDQLAVGRCSALLMLGRLADVDAALSEARSLKVAADAGALLDLVEADLAIVRGELERAGALIARVADSQSAQLPEVRADLWFIWALLELARGDLRAAASRAITGLGECGEGDSMAITRLTLAWWRSGGARGDPVPAGLGQPRPVGAESIALVAQIAAHRRRSPQAWAKAIAAWALVPAPIEVLRCRLEAALDARDLVELDRIADESRAGGAYGLSADADAAWRAAGGRRQPQRTAGVLTRREVEVLAAVAEGLTNREVADRLFISVRTVGAHLERCMAKLAVSTRGAAVHEARRQGLLTS